MFMEFEIKEVVNEVLDNDMGQCSLGDDSDSDDDYTQSVTCGIHKSVSDSDSVNDGDEQRTVTHDEQGIRLGGMSMRFVWQDISMLSAAWEIFCGIHGLQCNISNLDTVDIFENTSNTALFKIYPVIQHLNNKFQSVYLLS
jgi:hypothetical protein